MLPPYYNMIWHILPWYLDFGEFCFYRHQTNWCRIKEVTFQVNVVGHRLPFSTNEESSAMANSQVDQTLDLFRGMEKRWPHLTVYKNGLGDKIGTALRRKNPYYGIVKTLYGYRAGADIGFNRVSADRGYRRWHYMPKYFAKKNIKSSHPCSYSTWPAFASNKWQSIDLARYRGPVATINYKCKRGVLGQQPSVLYQQ